jgi:hypothetical protein
MMKMENWQIAWRALAIGAVLSFDAALISTFGSSGFVLGISGAILFGGLAVCLVPYSNPASEQVEIAREELELKKQLVTRELARMGKDWQLEKLEAKVPEGD